MDVLNDEDKDFVMDALQDSAVLMSVPLFVMVMASLDDVQQVDLHQAFKQKLNSLNEIKKNINKLTYILLRGLATSDDDDELGGGVI